MAGPPMGSGWPFRAPHQILLFCHRYQEELETWDSQGGQAGQQEALCMQMAKGSCRQTCPGLPLLPEQHAGELGSAGSGMCVGADLGHSRQVPGGQCSPRPGHKP